MILYVCNIREINDFSAASLLSPARRERIFRYRQQADQKRCLTAGLLLRYLLKEDAIRVCSGVFGKPYLPGGNVCFNLSHSGEYVVLAADEKDVGVDVESLAPVPKGLAERCFTKEECRWLSQQKDPQAAFYRLWTGKESIMKATGKGFSMPPETFSIMPPEDGLQLNDGMNWYLNWYALPGYSLCVASQRNEKTIMKEVSCLDLVP